MRKLIVTSAALAVLGITATAQAQPGGPVSANSDVTVPENVETLASLPSCPAGSTPSISPAPPTAVNLVYQSSSGEVTVGLAGVWTSAGSTDYTIKCSSTVTNTATVTVTAIPPENSAIGVGADTGGLIDQLSGDYNATLTDLPHRALYPWDTTNPITGKTEDLITPKANCPAFNRPDGSSEGIAYLAKFEKTHDGGYDCVNFAASSRPRAGTDPPYEEGGIAFVALASDAVTWAAQATDAPQSLTLAQLAAIYTCSDTNWDQVGGANAPIQPFVAEDGSNTETGSGTSTDFLDMLGVTPGPCVSNDNGMLQDGDGANSVLDTPEAIYPYSIGQYIAQRYHSPGCVNTNCTVSNEVTCVAPSPGQNFFGCDTHGKMELQEIDGVAPTTGTKANTVINPSFLDSYGHTLYVVVPYDPNTTDHIPGSTSPVGGVDLEKIFGSNGWACTSTAAQDDIADYGFTPLTTNCGVTY